MESGLFPITALPLKICLSLASTVFNVAPAVIKLSSSPFTVLPHTLLWVPSKSIYGISAISDNGDLFTVGGIFQCIFSDLILRILNTEY